MVVELGVYRARIGLFWTNSSELQQANMKKSGVNLASVWFFGILVAMMLVIGGIETNPGPQMEEKMERVLNHRMAQNEEGKGIRELLEKNKTSMEKLQNTINEFVTKIDQLSQSAKTMKEKQERIKNLVNSWEVKQKRIEGELSFVVDWRRKNNLLIFGIDEYPQESYINTLKITEEFLRTKIKVDVMNWHIDSAMRIGRRRGSQPILVRFTSYSKKTEVLKGTQNLAGTNIRIEKDYSMETTRISTELIPYLKDARRQGNIAFLRKDKLVMNRKIYELEYLTKNFHMASEVRIRDSPTHVEDKEMSQRPSQIQNRETPEQEGAEAEEGETVQGRDMSYQEMGEGQDDDTPVTQHATADEEIGDTRSNSLDLTQQNEGEKCVLLSPAGSVLELNSRQYNLCSWLTSRKVPTGTKKQRD
jgi:hypothetical protein